MDFGDAALPQRFWDKLSPEPNTGCWLWTAASAGQGYGYWTVNGKRDTALRSDLGRS